MFPWHANPLLKLILMAEAEYKPTMHGSLLLYLWLLYKMKHIPGWSQSQRRDTPKKAAGLDDQQVKSGAICTGSTPGSMWCPAHGARAISTGEV
jgi:hypothetical protein